MLNGPVTLSGSDDTGESLLSIHILPGMVDGLKKFPIGSKMKIQCRMVYTPGDYQIRLIGHALGARARERT